MTFPIGTELEIQCDASRDLSRYIACMMRGDDRGCADIEKKYGFYGLAPQQVSEELADIAASQEPQL